MPSRPDLPHPGTPMASLGRNSLRGVMQELSMAAEAAQPNIDVGGPAAIAGPSGLQVSSEAFPQLAVFQILERWNLAGVENGIFYPQQCAHASAKKVFYLAGPGTWQQLDNTADPIIETIWYPCGYQLDSIDADREMPNALQSAQQFMPAIGVGQWAWCHFDECAGVWQVMQPFEDVVRVQLIADWYSCCKAPATILLATGDAPGGANSSSGVANACIAFNTGYAITCFDPLGTIRADPASVYDPTTDHYYIPAGTQAVVKRFADDNAWEPLRFGGPGCSDCCQSSSSSSGSSSSGSSSSGITCPYPVGKETRYPNYKPCVLQFLGHDNQGCWIWIDYTDCNSSGSSSGC